jgi:CzcA family heavy metal efflux pump
MVRWIVGASLRYRFVVIALAAAMLLFGTPQLRNAPVDVFPEFAPPRVEIQTPCIGLTAEEVEELVTVPLEKALNGIQGIDVLRSKSVSDLSSIDLRFKRGVDPILARQLVAERVATVIPTLPTWAAPPVIMHPLSSTSRVMKIGLSSSEMDLMDLSMVTYWKIRARLLRVNGVANVAIWGERIKMPQVQVDPVRMRAHNVPLDEIMDVTGAALDVSLLRFTEGSVIGTGGFIETSQQRMGVRMISPLTTPEKLAEMPVYDRLKSDGTPLRLKDVADVVWDTWPLFGDAVINGGPGLMLIVEKFPWANTLEVTHGVEAALEELGPGLTGIEIDSSIFRPATFIEVSLENLTRALLIGCLLVMIVLAAFLFEWRTALISMAAIPLSLVAGSLVLYQRGETINTMILAGLAIAVGVVVDDAIIDVENIVRRLRQHRREGIQRSTASVVMEASIEVRGAIVYATLIDAVVVLPIFFIGGLSGAFFAPLALSYGLAVMASMLVALTVTPAMCLIMLKGVPVERRESPLARSLRQKYGALLARIIRRPATAVAALAAVVVLGVATLPFLGQSLLPSFKERDFLMHWLTLPGTSVGEEYRITVEAYNALSAIPGVRNFGAHIGQAMLADEVYGVYFGENWISVDPSADYDKTLAAVQEAVDSFPGLQRDVQTYLKERIKEVLTGASATFVVRIYGPDLQGLRGTAAAVRDTLQGTEGLVDLNVELQTSIPQIQVVTDLAAAQRHGVSPGDVRRASGIWLAGEEVGDIFYNGQTYDVNVWSIPAARHSVDDIRDVLVTTPSGGTVRLGDVASVQIVPAANHVERENDSRRIDVRANVRGRDLGAVARDVEERLKQVPMPPEYHARVLGEYAERQAAQDRLYLLAIAAAVGTLFCLQAAFGNWRLAILAFLTLPSALVGGVLAAYAGGGVISLGSMVGFLTVFGIAARNGIMLINHYQHLERYEGESFGVNLALRGAVERLSPILMTALATGLALVPLAVTGEIPGHEIEYPMALVILGGLVTSTLLNLFITPILYLRFGRGSAMARQLPLRVERRAPAIPRAVTAAPIASQQA